MQNQLSDETRKRFLEGWIDHYKSEGEDDDTAKKKALKQVKKGVHPPAKKIDDPNALDYLKSVDN